MRHRLITTLIFILFISGCSVNDSELGVPTTNGNSKPSLNTYDPGYPITTAPQPTTIEQTQDAEMAKVTGTILLNGEPVNYLRLFLADVLQSSDGVEIATSLDRLIAPTALSGEDGEFIFFNVPPGRYGLMLYEGLNSYLLLDPNNGKAILVSVQAGDAIDLGIYKFTDLPIN